MDAFKISVKLFAAQDDFAPAEFVPVFHRWIQEYALEDHMLIDVADYAHVAAGPGSLIVTHEANIHMDRAENRLGLLYFRKTELPGTFTDRLRQVVASALKVAVLLEQEASLNGRLKFRTDELSIKLNDRLLAPNSPATFAEVRSDFQSLADELYGQGKATVQSVGSPASVFDVTIKSASSATAAELLGKISPVAA